MLVRKWAICSCTNNDKTHSFPWSTLTSSHSPYSRMRGLLCMIHKQNHEVCVHATTWASCMINIIQLCIHACIYYTHVYVLAYVPTKLHTIGIKIWCRRKITLYISIYMYVWNYLNKFAYISTLFFTGIDTKPTILLLKPSIAAMCVTPNITSFSFWSI